MSARSSRLLFAAAVLVPLVLAASALHAVALAKDGDSAAALAVETITARDLQGHVSFLASEELEGRAIGERGGSVAHRYLASYYTRLGLAPAGADGTFLQPFESRSRSGRNVLAMIQGTDPALRDQIVVIGGHMDHLGRGRSNDGEVYNGADDNASGTAGILEIAEAFTAAPPRRSVLFFNTDGEEAGLLGSKHWVEHPTVPLGSVVAMLCLDMIGRSVDDYLFVGGVGTAPGFAQLIERQTKQAGLRPETAPGGRAPTDCMTFYGKDIPILFFFTNVHDDYHMPTDDIEKLDFTGMTRISRLIFLVASEIANADAAPGFAKDDSMSLPKDFTARMSARMALARANAPYLGVEPVEDEKIEGCVIGRVTPGSPAAAADLRDGDRIVAIDQEPVESFQGLRRVLGRRSVGDVVTLSVSRGGQSIELRATLGSFGK